MLARKADYNKFQELEVQVLGISASNVFSQMAFADSLELTHPLLSDHPDLKVSRAYGVLQHYVGDPDRLRSRRAFFLIDKDGIVQGQWLPFKQATLFASEPILQRAQELAGK